MTKVCLSGSLRFRNTIINVIKQGKTLGIEFLFPNIFRKDLFPEGSIIPLSQETIEQLEQDHLKAIDSTKILYVINPGGYVGEHVKYKIKYAKAQGKKVYFAEKTQIKEIDELCDGMIPLNSLDKLKDAV